METKRKKRFFIWLPGIIGAFLIALILLYILSIYSEYTNPPAQNVLYGVTFSPIAAEHLGFDWKEVYLAILDDLKVKNLRLPGYWSVIEKTQGEYNFEETDYLLEEAEKRGAKVILTLGIKQPRWPECHIPGWAKNLPIKERQAKALEFIKKTVDRYKGSPAIVAWQVENEPLLYFFGDNCDSPDTNFLKREVGLVRLLDSRQILLSDSGELSPWGTQMQLSDIFGTTLYRHVWNPVLGYTSYPLPPGAYSLKSNFFRNFFAPDNLKTIVIELQAEPWLPKNNPSETPVEEQIEIFPLSLLEENLNFAKKTSFDEIYLWGVEWWYFMKQKGYPEYWDFAGKLFTSS